MAAIFLKGVVSAAGVPNEDKKKKLYPQVALLGRSNSGKSSLINHLASAKNLARTSARPGLTRTINLYEFDESFTLADMPGYGYSSADRSDGEGFGAMIGGYLSEVKDLRLILLIIDARRGLTDADRYAIAQLTGQKLPYAVICNKVDKLKHAELITVQRALATELPGIPVILHTTQESKGLGEIRELIKRHCRPSAS